MINVLFQEIIEGTALITKVSDDEFTISDNARHSAYNTKPLEKHLSDFITEKCS